MSTLTIGLAARAAGVGVETIRFYQRRGLIARPPKPSGTGIRRYAPETVQRVRFIRQAQHLGFTLRQIEELLSLEANPEADCSDVRLRALAKIEEVDGRIGQLAEIRSALVRLMAACPGSGALGACSILGAMRVSESSTLNPLARGRRRAGKRGTMKDANFRIDGMHCEGCAQTIEALLGAERGVEHAAVSFEAHAAQVRFDPAVVDDRQIVSAIERAGYKVVAQSR
ncbi:MAG: MerR family transcriptional regulator [Burkholderiales bacterium]